MTDLVAFLEARLDEDEAAARAAQEEPLPDNRFGRGTRIAYGLQSASIGLGYQAFALVWDPARVLAEITAKRRVLARHRAKQPLVVPEYGLRSWRVPCLGCGYDGAVGVHRTEDVNKCPELLGLADIWCTHPDFREEWRT